MCRLLLLVAMVICAVSCASDDNFTLMSTKNVNLGLSSRMCFGTYTGTSGMCFFLGSPLGDLPSIKDATDSALEQGHGNVLLNAVVHKNENYFFYPFFYYFGYEVKGDVYRIDPPGSM